jgi:hypothetical protein
MLYGNPPRWLEWAERRLRWLAVPELASLLVGLQAIGYVLILVDPGWFDFLCLDPGRVLRGEIWRLGSFLALPMFGGPISTAIGLYFLYFIVNGLEEEWGAFLTTFYVLISVLLSIAFAFVFHQPITSVIYLESTLFLAAATVAPDYEILLFFVLPVKLKWLAWILVFGVGQHLLVSPGLERLYLLLMFGNYLLFFGPDLLGYVRAWERRRRFRAAAHRPDDDEENH